MSHNSCSRFARVAAFVLLTLLLSGCTARFLFRVPALSSDSAKNAKTLSDEAYSLILENKYEEAIQKASLAVEKNPTFAEAQKNLALAYCDSGHSQEALEPAQKAVALAPDFDKARFVLAKTLFQLGRLEDAIPEFEQAVRINPKYGKAYFMLGRTYDLLNRIDDANIALNQAFEITPKDPYYQDRRDCLLAYINHKKSGEQLPHIVPIAEHDPEYARAVYRGIFYEALIHRDYNLIDTAADQARSSKEKLPGAAWKLQEIYFALEEPYDSKFASDFEWNHHLDLLKEWTKLNPNSPTASVALAACYVAYAWHARGGGYANTVRDEDWAKFSERLSLARKALSSGAQPHRCPNWYSVMQQIALGEHWDRDTYDQLFEEAVSYEPAWYDYYKQKAVFLMPRWYGSAGELETYIESLGANSRTDSAILYFLVSEFAATYSQDLALAPATFYPVLKKGFVDLKRTYGTINLDLNWACYKALDSNDREFAIRLFPEIGDQPTIAIWGSKEAFERAKKFATQIH